MKISFIVSVATLAVLLSTDTAKACSCAEASPCEAFGYASAVFVGRMLGGSEKYREYTDKGVTVSLEAGLMRFAVEESFKGVTATEVTVLAMNMKGTSCEGMAALASGRRYLVYAGALQSGALSIGPCSATKPIDRATTDLAFLRNLQPSRSGGRLYGRVAVTGDKEPTPLADVTIIVEDEAHSQVKIKTDREGNFEINGLRPGKYLVNPVLPDNYVFGNDRQKNRAVQVTDRGCVGASFWVSANGRIGGRVSDSSGRPAPAYVWLESADQHQRTFLNHTDREGEYQIQGIPPGQYLLKIQMKKDDKQKDYYYPDTSDRMKATLFGISMGQQIEGRDFNLPLPFQIVVVQGTAVYADGRAASKVEVRLISDSSINSGAYQVDDSYSETQTDGLGRFTVYGYRGLTYKILVLDNLRRASEEQRDAGRAETEKMLLNKDKDNIKVPLPLKPHNAATKSLKHRQAFQQRF